MRYLHSDIETPERMAIVRDLRRGEFDVLVGINLLREGLDLPEVSWWPSWTPTKRASCARPLPDPDHGPGGPQCQRQVVMYADQVTDSMRRAVEEPCAAASCRWNTTRSTA